jgi:hypothetical protein
MLQKVIAFEFQTSSNYYILYNPLPYGLNILALPILICLNSTLIPSSGVHWSEKKIPFEPKTLYVV